MICTRCNGTGFLNSHQIDDETLNLYDVAGDPGIIFDWVADTVYHDVCMCDCCSDGDYWYNEPGEHDWDNPRDRIRCQ